MFSLSATAALRHILVRDFRTVKDGQVVCFNVGTAAHGPATLAVLEKQMPGTKLSVWADAPLAPELQRLMSRRFPGVKIYTGPEVPETDADLFLVSSGSSIADSVQRSIGLWRQKTERPVAAYAIGYGSALKPLTESFSACFFRDKTALARAKAEKAVPAVTGFAPDAVFDFDAADEAGADAFLAANGLERGLFVCAIPGERRTATWTYFGGKPDEQKVVMNAAHELSDNAVVCAAIVEAVRRHGMKVLLCAEQHSEMPLIGRALFAQLPDDVKDRCVRLKEFWPPDLALGVYRRSRCVFGIEMHSQVMAIGSGVPAVVMRHEGFGSKSDMMKDVGLGDWLMDIDEPGAAARAARIVGGILADETAAKAKLTAARAVIDRETAAAVGAMVRLTSDRSLVDFGAKPDGTKCTEAFAKAVDACAANGGGRVIVPSGTWFTGPIHLKSNVELHLDDGAKIVFSDDYNDYLPAVRTNWEGVEVMGYSPLVYACGCTNVAITGKGTLAPRVEGWVPWRTPKGMSAARTVQRGWGENAAPLAERDVTKLADAGFRPHLLQFLDCKDVRLEDFTIRGAPFWTIHLCRAEKVLVRGLDVSAWSESGIAMNNTDGIDIEMSRDVTVEGCTFRQNDDAIVLKAGRDREGRERGCPCENVVISNCTVNAGHTLLGLGSELSAGIRNVRLSNCRVDCEVRRLLYVKTNPRRGGFVENITVDGVTAKKVTQDVIAVSSRYFYGMPGQEVAGPHPNLTRISGVTLRNVHCDWAKRAVTLLCDPDYPATDFRLENVVIDEVFENFVKIENVDGIKLDVTAKKVQPDAHW